MTDADREMGALGARFDSLDRRLDRLEDSIAAWHAASSSRLGALETDFAACRAASQAHHARSASALGRAWAIIAPLSTYLLTAAAGAAIALLRR